MSKTIYQHGLVSVVACCLLFVAVTVAVAVAVAFCLFYTIISSRLPSTSNNNDSKTVI